MVVKRCDICGCEIRNSGSLKIKYKAKRWNFFQGWEEADICNFCLEEIGSRSLKRRKEVESHGTV